MEKPKVGDRVRVLPYLFKLRAKWGGWYPSREEYIGCVGVVTPFEDYKPWKSDEDFWIPKKREDVPDIDIKIEVPYIPEIKIDLDVEYVRVAFTREANKFVPEYADKNWENRAMIYRLDQLEVIDEKG